MKATACAITALFVAFSFSTAIGDKLSTAVPSVASREPASASLPVIVCQLSDAASGSGCGDRVGDRFYVLLQYCGKNVRKLTLFSILVRSNSTCGRNC